MGQEQSQEEPKPGDLIEFPWFLYQHWAVYVGDGNIIHLTGNGSFNVLVAPSGSLGSPSTKKAVVKKEKLRDVMGNMKPRVNNQLDEKYKPRPFLNILRDAEALVGREVSYNVIKCNCEHFANALRYGRPESRQVVAGEVGLITGTALGALAAVGISIASAVNRN